jgi:hypothetical protein
MTRSARYCSVYDKKPMTSDQEGEGVSSITSHSLDSIPELDVRLNILIEKIWVPRRENVATPWQLYTEKFCQSFSKEIHSHFLSHLQGLLHSESKLMLIFRDLIWQPELIFRARVCRG